jgi:hypothetical protein
MFIHGVPCWHLEASDARISKLSIQLVREPDKVCLHVLQL